jgi:hypothetical protein
MDDVKTMLERQADWQKSRAKLSWAEKVRMAEAVRESVATLRRSWRPASPSKPETKSLAPPPSLDPEQNGG